MLKFLRKYNLIIMVIGGSLLMVVFLLQPILTRLSPDPGKRKAATIGDTVITRRDLAAAANDVHLLERFLPFITYSMRLENDSDHYYLLLHEAQESGLVGEAGDGRDWIPELSAEAARIQTARAYMQQGIPAQYIDQLLNQPAAIQQIAQLAIEMQPDLNQNRINIAAGIGQPAQRMDQALANARGIARLRARYDNAIRLSDRQAIAEASKDMNSAVADTITLAASLFADDIPEPTEAQLQAHFDQFAAEIPGSGELGFGYRQPPSIKLAWLTLDPAPIAAAIKLDPVEVRKRYAQDRARHPGEFADERLAIETEMRREQVESLMVEADQIIRREVLAATRRLPEDDAGYRVLPADWDQTRPRLADVAAAIVNQIRESRGITIPYPEVQLRNADWLTSADIGQITTIGRAGLRIGAQTAAVYDLPDIVRESQTGIASPLKAQVGVPLVETPAEDAAGRRYYFTILAARPESPPDSLDDVREQVIADVKDKLAYERLISEKDRLVELAQTDGLQAIEALFATNTGEPELDDEGNPIERQNFGPKVDDMVQIRRTSARSLVRPRLLDSRLQAAQVGEVIIEAAAERLDPTAPIGSSPQAESIVAAESPSQRVLVIARLKAFRPMTIEDYRPRAGGLARQIANNLLVSAIQEGDIDPFSYDALRRRLNYVKVRSDDDFASSDTDDQPADESAEG